MSVESLLSEVTNILGSRLAVKAADQAFFGGKQVYTGVSSAVGAGSSAAVDGLVSEIASLKKENQDIKSELAQLKKLFEELSVKVSKHFFDSAKSILVLGDGNLSFSLALSRLLPSGHITATVLEDEELFLNRYAVFDTVNLLRQSSNVDLIFGVDATKLPSNWIGKFDMIIMNFPHPGGKTNLLRSKKLASGIFRSVRSVLTPGCSFHLSLAIGQSGISPGDPLLSDDPPIHKKDSWQIIYLAAEQGLALQSLNPMTPELYPGYQASGYRTTGKGFNNNWGAQRFCFQVSHIKPSFDQLVSPPRSCKKFNLYLPYYYHDVSFLFDCEDSLIDGLEDMIFKMLYELSGNMIIRISELNHLRSMCPDPYLPNRIYRLIWQPLIPIGKLLCNDIQDELRLRIVDFVKRNRLPLVLT